MLARGSVSAQQPSPTSTDDDVVGDGPDGDNDNDNDACDGSSECSPELLSPSRKQLLPQSLELILQASRTFSRRMHP